MLRIFISAPVILSLNENGVDTFYKNADIREDGIAELYKPLF